MNVIFFFKKKKTSIWFYSQEKKIIYSCREKDDFYLLKKFPIQFLLKRDFYKLFLKIFLQSNFIKKLNLEKWFYSFYWKRDFVIFI